ncbi:GTP pyrophosphokinase family protein [Lysinibacillus sp. 3P01SB]|uniref:GTP pyrophosphokinase n=1 Tax=Lysinibacillus sp. 3P01SB TaxID=3132284 RepID=UPI0039A506D7
MDLKLLTASGEMKMEIREWEKKYREQRFKYESLTNRLRTLLEELLKTKGIKVTIESRTKEIDSFLGKVNRPNKSYENPLDEITDLSGIRLIVNSVNDVDEVAKIITDQFIIDKDKSINKSDLLSPDQFGYLSQHYIVKLNDARTCLPEWADLKDFWAEIQVRTVLQHAWAVISHSLDYKNQIDVPTVLRRRLFRLSAMFELADEELNSLILKTEDLSIEYKHQISSDGITELNLDSLKVYLEESRVVNEWANFIESLNVKIGPIGMISRDVEMCIKVGINTINELNELLEKSFGWGEEYLKDFYEHTFGKIVPKGCSTDRNGIITLLLIANFPEVFTDEVLDSELGFGNPKSATIPAMKFNPKYQG